MARNKYPQETVDKILDVSLKLFREKGFEHTTIQDIIDHLGGLTKGAIYHHFKSKEDIFYAIAERQGEQVERDMLAIRDQQGKTGLEKLREMFVYSVTGSIQSQLNEASPIMLDSPWLLAASMRSQFTEVIPHFIYPVVLEGVQDGSIRTEHPKELAELSMVASNFWLSPMVFPATQEEVEARVRYFGEALRTLGLELLDERLTVLLIQGMGNIARTHQN